MVDYEGHPPPAPEAFRAAGFLWNPDGARALSREGAEWLAGFNGIGLARMPAAWRWAPNPAMKEQIERRAKEDEGDGQ